MSESSFLHIQLTIVTSNLLVKYADMATHTTVLQKQEVKIIWQKAPHGGPIPRLGVTPGGRKLYHWIPGLGFPISVP